MLRLAKRKRPRMFCFAGVTLGAFLYSDQHQKHCSGTGRAGLIRSRAPVRRLSNQLLLDFAHFIKLLQPYPRLS